jgi:hypothetical protein
MVLYSALKKHNFAVRALSFLNVVFNRLSFFFLLVNPIKSGC